MKPRGSVQDLQGLYNNPYTEPNQSNLSKLTTNSLRSILIFSPNQDLDLLKCLFPVSLSVKIHGTNYEFSHYEGLFRSFFNSLGYNYLA